MFGKRFRLKTDGESERNKPLSTLLHQWKSVEPHATFEADVWRRIRVAESNALSPRDVLRDWILPHPAWAGALAASLAVMVGVGTAFTVPTDHESAPGSEPLLHSQTLAGSYLAMATGETR